MLTSTQRDIIKATVPLLETGGEALITYFYQLMLDTHPEVRPLFNQANQANGSQPRALANGVLMYARNIDRLENLGGLASQIINKHVALQILPEHYPIVGACLLQAIREVLGAETATDEVIEAWAAAYQQLADILIAGEQSAYDAIAAAPGGWRGARPFTVQRKVAESAEITSFYLAPTDHQPVIRHKAGQYIGVRLMIDGQEVRRNYSLSEQADGVLYRISAKREQAGSRLLICTIMWKRAAHSMCFLLPEISHLTNIANHWYLSAAASESRQRWQWPSKRWSPANDQSPSFTMPVMVRRMRSQASCWTGNNAIRCSRRMSFTRSGPIMRSTHRTPLAFPQSLTLNNGCLPTAISTLIFWAPHPSWHS